MTTVRRIRLADVDELFQMVRDLADYENSLAEVQSSADDFRVALFGPAPQLFGHVVEHGSRLAGFAVWYVSFSTWTGKHGIYLEDLYVRPEHRGSGFGRALLVELARLCVERGYARLEWWVLDWNEPALRFYSSLGATSMDEWTQHRLTGPSLDALGGFAHAP